MPQPLSPQGKSSCYPLGRRLGEPQSCSEHGDEEKNSQSLPIYVNIRFATWHSFSIIIINLILASNLFLFPECLRK
jgi:hypothetical protein